ncbi:MAG: hypothetical protein HQK55_07095 [Deltaproteobacteria bacterium]|nr:hypothetical protein [Deltaproteobacteria bacterium]
MGQTLCEECYMDILTPVRSCAPKSVDSVRSFVKHADATGELTPLKQEILRILKETGAIEPLSLLHRLGGTLTMSELESNFSTLRNMGKARDEKRSGRVVWRLW